MTMKTIFTLKNCFEIWLVETGKSFSRSESFELSRRERFHLSGLSVEEKTPVESVEVVGQDSGEVHRDLEDVPRLLDCRQTRFILNTT